MTQEEKELLLKDLCARLPYGVKLKVGNDALSLNVFYFDGGLYKTIEKVISAGHKMYLRPMSSMTEDESKDFAMLQTDFYSDGWLYPIAAVNMVDWLIAHHFDYRGLIERGLALEATEWMYNTKTE